MRYGAIRKGSPKLFMDKTEIFIDAGYVNSVLKQDFYGIRIDYEKITQGLAPLYVIIDLTGNLNLKRSLLSLPPIP